MSSEYLDSINIIPFDDLDLELQNYADINDVPIIKDEGLCLLRQLVNIKNPKRILEIGTAIGYSAINMAKYSNAIIDTVEINQDMYNKACENIKRSGFDNRINTNLCDALLYETNEKYDFIFIDAAKAQYIKFFTRFKENLNQGGVILTDNLIFHGLVTEKIYSRNLRQLVTKIKKYNNWVVEQPDFDTYIYNIGDGIAISIKK